MPVFYWESMPVTDCRGVLQTFLHSPIQFTRCCLFLKEICKSFCNFFWKNKFYYSLSFVNCVFARQSEEEWGERDIIYYLIHSLGQDPAEGRSWELWPHLPHGQKEPRHRGWLLAGHISREGDHKQSSQNSNLASQAKPCLKLLATMPVTPPSVKLLFSSLDSNTFFLSRTHVWLLTFRTVGWEEVPWPVLPLELWLRPTHSLSHLALDRRTLA